MQNRYVGDVGDFGKYALLRALCGHAGGGPILKLGIVWCYFPDESHYDDGRHINYLNKEPYRSLDPQLFDGLRKLVKDGRRSLAEVECADLFSKDTQYFR